VTSRIGGQTIIGCVREETDDEFQRAEHLARGGLTNIQVPPISEIPKRKTFPLFWIAFLEILIYYDGLSRQATWFGKVRVHGLLQIANL
jgi:hypothetical protein